MTDDARKRRRVRLLQRYLINRRWREGRAQTVPEDDPSERLRSFGRERHAANVQRFGTDLLTLRFDLADESASIRRPE